MKPLIVLLGVIFSASVVFAQLPKPRFYLTAEQVVIPASSSNCSLVGTTTKGQGILCTDSSSGTLIFLYTHFPKEAPDNIWGFDIWYEAPVATSLCSWDITAAAIVNASPLYQDNTKTLTLDGTSQAHAADTIYNTDTLSTPYTVKNQSLLFDEAQGVPTPTSDQDCVNQVCQGVPVIITLEINDTNTTAASCTFKALEINP